MSPLFTPLPEYERLARNQPHPSIDKAYPKVTDGTLAAIAQETPKRYIQQLPSGSVDTDMDEWFDLIANWKLQEDIIPHANCQADPLQKSWRAGSNSLTYGSSHFYVFMDSYDGELRADFKIPYITHVYLQKGKISSRECKFMFLESWYQESDIDYIIDREKAMKKEDSLYKGEWDIKELEAIKTSRQSKNEEQKTPNERARNENAEEDGIRIIHAFQQGIGAEFYSFMVDMAGQEANIRVVRTKVNKDPRGKIPIHTLYCNIDLSNPLGRGIMEQSGGMQNLLDSHTQSFQYIQALQLAPPMKKRGRVPKGSVKYVPNAIIDLGTDPGADVEAFKIDTTALSNFPDTYGLIKSQILNLNNSADTSISSEAGNPGFSKTDSGVDAQMERLGVSDNYLRRQYEATWEEVCETMLNLTFAETNGAREEKLDKKTADKLRELIPEGNEYVVWVDIENSDTIVLDYDKLGQKPIYFTVDASTSRVKEDSSQVESLSAVKELVAEMLPPSKQMALANKFIDKLGVEDPEEVKFTKEEIEEVAMMEKQPQTADPMLDPAMQDPMADPMMTEQMQPEMEQPMQEMPMDFTPEEIELIDGLEQRGFDDAAIEQGVLLLREGFSDEEITQVLIGGANV